MNSFIMKHRKSIIFSSLNLASSPGPLSISQLNVCIKAGRSKGGPGDKASLDLFISLHFDNAMFLKHTLCQWYVLETGILSMSCYYTLHFMNIAFLQV